MGKRHSLLMTEYFTKAAETESLEVQDNEAVVSEFFNRWIFHQRPPKVVHNKQGTNYRSLLFTQLCKASSIIKMRIGLRHLQSYGQVKRTNRTLVKILKTSTKTIQP
ncbi:hypothetical protein TSMEX_009670 [Taenia solium]|eukprot:TsM_000238000 transcript=TsM_000238000 gene=TsM_000238000